MQRLTDVVNGVGYRTRQARASRERSNLGEAGKLGKAGAVWLKAGFVRVVAWVRSARFPVRIGVVLLFRRKYDLYKVHLGVVNHRELFGFYV